MKYKKTWVLQKIQVQGVRDDTVYAAGTQVIFTHESPWLPVLNSTESDNVALSLVRHEEAWWIINYSDEWCCTVNEQIVEPHHRMRLNDGDLIEWGLSSWRLILRSEQPLPSRPAPLTHHSVPPPESVAEFLDLDWFKQQQINPQQDPFDIIPARGTASHNGSAETDNALVQLYQEYQQALLSPEQEPKIRKDPFPLNESIVTQDLTTLYDSGSQTDTLQEMVAGTLSIDDILDTLDATGDEETAWPAAESLPDILRLLSPERSPQKTYGTPLPDLTQREHRIIGIDSHYRITPAQKNGNTSHEKK